MKKRIITALIMAVVLLPILLIDYLAHAFELFMIFVVVGASLELLFMYDKEEKSNIGIKITVVALTLLLYLSIIYSFKASFMASEAFDHSLLIGLIDKVLHIEKVFNPLSILILMFIVLMGLSVFVSSFKVADIGKYYLAIIYVAVCVAAFNVLRVFGIRFVFYLLLVTIFTDIFALVFGLTMGKHKMAPNISPKKTWEGAIGGTAVALVLGMTFALCYKQIAGLFGLDKIEFFDGIINGYADLHLAVKIVFIFFLTLFLSICSQTGDLVASKLKRNYGIKDYSNIFPGHGGILDRFDSSFFASAIFLLFVYIAMLASM